MTERTKRMLEELDPMAQPIFRKFIEALDSVHGDDRYYVFEGRRSTQVQEAYYAQGRKPLNEVNELRKLAGLYLLRSERDNYTITWTLKSKHLEGLAMDIVPMKADGNPTWDMAHYSDAFVIITFTARNLGLECGADWPGTQKDWPHFQIKD